MHSLAKEAAELTGQPPRIERDPSIQPDHSDPDRCATATERTSLELPLAGARVSSGCRCPIVTAIRDTEAFLDDLRVGV